MTQEEKDNLGNNFCDAFYIYNKEEKMASLTIDDVVQWWLSQIDTIIEKKLNEEKNIHFCCKYQTYKKEKFCDYCLLKYK